MYKLEVPKDPFNPQGEVSTLFPLCPETELHIRYPYSAIVAIYPESPNEWTIWKIAAPSGLSIEARSRKLSTPEAIEKVTNGRIPWPGMRVLVFIEETMVPKWGTIRGSCSLAGGDMSFQVAVDCLPKRRNKIWIHQDRIVAFDMGNEGVKYVR